MKEGEKVVKALTESAKFLETIALEKDNHVTLFRAEDMGAWITFTCVFVVLIIFDNVLLHRNPKALTLGRAACYTIFWVACAGAFCYYVYRRYGWNSAFDWTSGYMLEWMLSFDNLFVFHLIFSVYATPDHLKHKPLYYGICGAIFFRLLFIFIGEYMMHSMAFAHFLFGGFLIYTGVKSVSEDDDDEDPSSNPMVLWLSKHVPFVGCYDSKGSFFVRVPVDARGDPILPANIRRNSALPHANDEEEPLNGGEEQKYGTMDFDSVRTTERVAGYQTRATMLFLVVCCLEISDILFAVDSVSAIVAQVPDLFLAYTSTVFAMLGLRATFFIIDVLVKLFSLLKYGVAAVLVFIGIKLIISKMVHIPPGLVCVILFTTLASSMVASVIKAKYFDTEEEEEENDEGKKILEDSEQFKVAKVA